MDERELDQYKEITDPEKVKKNKKAKIKSPEILDLDTLMTLDE